MAKLILPLIFLGLMSSAVAQPRPYAPGMTCRAVAGIVASRGAVVISTSPTTYDRYVRDRSFCQITEITDPAWVWTRDNPQCFVGYTCREPDGDDIFIRR